ncbi:MAG: hypothetical protein K2X77_14285 [Candidatus Obscuribacterales bacterium]|jgi:hypothetical protein|nr:hypothetical protein [Candidatus Obscuribacterales bacterium]
MHELPILPILAFWAVTGAILYAAKSVSRPKVKEEEEEDSGTDLITGLFQGFLPKSLLPKSPAKKRAGAKTKSKSKKSAASVSSESGKQNEDAAKVNSCQQYMQCAIDQKAQAENAASRANSGNRDSRLSAASQAQYHADSARNWADKTASTAYGASSLAQDAAARARDAANRAQEAANRARYNAETCRQ